VAAIITAARNPNKDLMWTEAKAVLEPPYNKYNNLFNKGVNDGEAKVSAFPFCAAVSPAILSELDQSEGEAVEPG
jgi:hypothetical protein